MSPTNTKRVVGAALVVTAAVLAIVLAAGGHAGHRFSAVVPAAANIVKGNPLTVGGRPVGTVTGVEPVDHGRAARIEMKLEDATHWPLTTTTELEVRMGGTVSFVNRYVLITKRPGGTPIPDGGQVPPANVTIPVELDTVISKITPPVQRGIERLIGNGARVAVTAGPDLHDALAVAPPVVADAAHLLGDLTRNQQQLATLVGSSSRVVDSIDRSTPGLRELLSGLGNTLTAVASRQQQLRTALDRFPGALRQTRTTLSTADATLRRAGVLTDRIAPGVTALRRTIQPLDVVLAQLRDVAPDVRRTLSAVGRSKITSQALDRVARVLPQVTSIGEQATTVLDCVRPYAPEVAGFGTTWADWMSPVDDRDHLVRAQIQSFLPANYNSVPLTPAQVVKANPGIEYAFPRPPGALAGQPWFQPQCGAGRDALDPTKDQEAKTLSSRTPSPASRKGASR